MRWLSVLLVVVGCAHAEPLVLRGGTVYDGTGGPGRQADVAIEGGRIVAVGTNLKGQTLDVSGLAVAPGFINMLSWGAESLLVDGRGLSDLLQGVTLQVFGEGRSMGPLNDAQAQMLVQRGVHVTWRSLDAFLRQLESQGVTMNVASLVGASTLRGHVVGLEAVPATPQQIQAMQTLLRQAMVEGAMGVGSALIYPPGSYADRAELTALASVAAQFDGLYTSHIRSEGNQIESAVQELIAIARQTGVRADIHHLKMSGQDNWSKQRTVVAQIEAARADGVDVAANMYTYPAGSTGLDAALPPWVQEGGLDRWLARLENPEIRARVQADMLRPDPQWENFYLAAGPDNMLLVEFRNPDLRQYIGKTLAEVAAMRQQHPARVAIDLLRENQADVGVVYFLMSEENVTATVGLPWVSFGSDGRALVAEPPFSLNSTHPRAYGNFARLLGRYVRERNVVPLPEAIRRLTQLPAQRLGLRDRGSLRVGHFADVVVFDPATVMDHATFENPHQYASGVVHVFVNGVHTVREGAHTGAFAGRVVRGPGWQTDRQNAHTAVSN